MTCQARQYSDQKHCERCNLTWDMNDFDPPECLTIRVKEIGKRTIATLQRDLSNDQTTVNTSNPAYDGTR